MENINKIKSSLQKDINRLRETCTVLNESNKLRKYQISRFNCLVKKLLNENRLTVEELREFMDKKENITNGKKS